MRFLYIYIYIYIYYRILFVEKIMENIGKRKEKIKLDFMP
jgi:hypothetical protein